MAQIVNIPLYVNEYGETPHLLYSNHFTWSEEFLNKFVFCGEYGTHAATDYAKEKRINGKYYIILYDSREDCYKENQKYPGYEEANEIWTLDYPPIKNTGEIRYIMTKNEFDREHKLERILKDE
jgi:hypothetical protein